MDTARIAVEFDVFSLFLPQARLPKAAISRNLYSEKNRSGVKTELIDSLIALFLDALLPNSPLVALGYHFEFTRMYRCAST